ncbi:MAG: VOC family protein [Thermoplasmata archaeon]|jgi:catechol 2,3-dioxygenase-like lactoylglutathione lyase family enzyme
MPYQVRFVYSGIRVRDLARSVAFYRRIGFRVIKKGWFSHGGKWVHLTFPGSPHRIELNWYPKGTPFYEPFRSGTEFDHFGFYVSDTRRWLRSVLRAGAKPVVGFVDGPAHLVFVRDPDGIWLGACGPSTPGSLPHLLPRPRTRRKVRPTVRRGTTPRTARPRKRSIASGRPG